MFNKKFISEILLVFYLGISLFGIVEKIIFNNFYIIYSISYTTLLGIPSILLLILSKTQNKVLQSISLLFIYVFLLISSIGYFYNKFLLFYFPAMLALISFIVYTVYSIGKNKYRSSQDLFITGEGLFLIGVTLISLMLKNIEIPTNISIWTIISFTFQMFAVFVAPTGGIVLMLISFNKYTKKKQTP
jgi:hypothetical protein